MRDTSRPSVDGGQIASEALVGVVVVWGHRGQQVPHEVCAPAIAIRTRVKAKRNHALSKREEKRSSACTTRSAYHKLVLQQRCVP